MRSNLLDPTAPDGSPEFDDCVIHLFISHPNILTRLQMKQSKSHDELKQSTHLK